MSIEPVAWVECAVLPWLSAQTKDVYAVTHLYRFPNETYDTPIYAVPPKREWVSLTDEEIKEIVGPWGETPVKGYTRKLFDAIEAKLKEKNHGW
jgi:hypothetical protein